MEIKIGAKAFLINVKLVKDRSGKLMNWKIGYRDLVIISDASKRSFRDVERLANAQLVKKFES